MKIPFLKGIRKTQDYIQTGTPEVLRTVQEYSKLEQITDARVIYVDKSKTVYGLNEGDVLRAKLNQSEDFVKINGVDRLFFINGLYKDTTGKKVVFISDSNHHTIDLNLAKGKLKDDSALAAKFPNAVMPDLTSKIEYIDSKESKEFTIDADKVINTVIFKLLEDTPNKTIMMMLVIGFLGGCVFASILTFIFMIAMELIKALV